MERAVAQNMRAIGKLSFATWYEFSKVSRKFIAILTKKSDKKLAPIKMKKLMGGFQACRTCEPSFIRIRNDKRVVKCKSNEQKNFFFTQPLFLANVLS